jgi:hypothetical protein
MRGYEENTKQQANVQLHAALHSGGELTCKAVLLPVACSGAVVEHVNWAVILSANGLECRRSVQDAAGVYEVADYSSPHSAFWPA